MKAALAALAALAVVLIALPLIAGIGVAPCGTPAVRTGVQVGPVGAINTPTDFAWALLTALGAPATQANAGSIVAWADREGGHWYNGASFNPLNTTLKEPDSHPMNSVGVQAYVSWQQGLQATVATLAHYPDISAAFAGGLGLTRPLAGLSRWSGGAYNTVTPVPVIAPPPVTPTLASSPTVAGYVNPFAQPGWGPARTDMGVDWIPGVPLPVVAIGNGVVTYSSMNSGWPGGAFITIQLSDGSHAGDHIYVAEHLDNLLPVGTQVTAGQTIATAFPGYPWTEWGFAAAIGPTPISPYNGAADGTPTDGGKAFARFLIELGAKPLMDPGPGPDRISGSSTPATLVSATCTTSGTGTRPVPAACTNPQPATVEAAPGADLAAVVAGAPAGAVIRLGAGRFAATGATPKDGQIIEGAGSDVTVVAGSGAPVAFTGTAANVVLTGFTVEGFAPPRLHAAIDATASTNWTICNLHATAIEEECLAVGPGSLVDNLVADHCGNVGIGTGAVNNDPHSAPFANLGFTVQNSTLSYNGAQDPVDAAGVKVLFTNGATFTNNVVSGNFGMGLWVDGWTTNSTFSGNHVTNNQGAGIFVEISSTATISGNTITANGLGMCAGQPYFCAAAGVSVSDSHDVTVSGNTIEGNHDSVAVFNGHSSTALLYNIQVHNNVLAGGTSGLVTIPADPQAAATTSFTGNTWPAGPALIGMTP